MVPVAGSLPVLRQAITNAGYTVVAVRRADGTLQASCESVQGPLSFDVADFAAVREWQFMCVPLRIPPRSGAGFGNDSIARYFFGGIYFYLKASPLFRLSPPSCSRHRRLRPPTVRANHADEVIDP